MRSGDATFPSRFLSILTACLLLAVVGCAEENVSGTPDLLEQGREAYSLGQFTEAEKFYQDYLESREEGVGRWEAWSRLVDISLSVHGDFEIGAERLEIMILEFGEDSQRRWELLIRLAEVYETMHDWDNATDAWQQALNVPDLEDQKIPEVHWRLAKIYQYRGDYDLALDSLDRCLDSASQPAMDASCLFDKSQTLVYMQRTYEARQILVKLTELEGIGEKQRALAVFKLADLLEQIDEFERAEELLLSIRESYPNPLVVETRLKHLREVKQAR